MLTRDEIDCLTESFDNEELLEYLVRYSRYIEQGYSSGNLTIETCKDILASVKAEILKRMTINN